MQIDLEKNVIATNGYGALLIFDNEQSYLVERERRVLKGADFINLIFRPGKEVIDLRTMPETGKVRPHKIPAGAPTGKE